MNISELIAELEELKTIHGDLQIHVWADHGQSCTKAYSVGMQHIDEDFEVYADDDLDDVTDFTQIIEIAG